MVSRMKHESPARRPQLISSSDSVTGIVRFTGNAKLKPWMQILQANLPRSRRSGDVREMTLIDHWLAQMSYLMATMSINFQLCQPS